MLHNCLCPPFDQTRTSCTRKELTVLITDLDIKEDALQTVSRRADVGVVRGERESVCVGEGVKAERFVHWWRKGDFEASVVGGDWKPREKGHHGKGKRAEHCGSYLLSCSHGETGSKLKT